MAETSDELPTDLREVGVGPGAALSAMFDDVLGQSRDLGVEDIKQHLP